MYAELEQACDEAKVAAMQLVTDIHDGSTKLPLSQMCMQLLSVEEQQLVGNIPSLDNIGSDAESVADMGKQRQQQLVRVAGLLVQAVCRLVKAGDADLGGVLKLVLQKTTLPLLKEMRTKKHSLAHPVCAQLANSYIKARQLGHREVARQLLSVVTASLQHMHGITQADVMAAFSCTIPLVPGDRVDVIMGRNKHYRAGIVQDQRILDVDQEVDAEEPDTATSGIESTDPEGMLWVKLVPGSERLRSSWEIDDTMGATTSMDDAEQQDDPSAEILVQRSKLIAPLDVRLDKKAVTTAHTHAKTADYPGAPVTFESRKVFRMHMRGFLHFVRFCGSSQCIKLCSSSSASTVRAERVQLRSRLHVLYQDACEKDGITLAQRVRWRIVMLHW